MLNIELPQFGEQDLSDARERKKIMNYLYRLTEQLKYALANIELSDLTPESRTAITRAAQGAQQARQEVQDTALRLKEQIIAAADEIYTDHTQRLNVALEGLESVYVKEAAYISAMGTLQQTLSAQMEQNAHALTLSFAEKLNILAGEVADAVELAAKFQFSAEGMTVNRSGELVYLFLDNTAVQFRKGSDVLAAFTVAGLDVPALTAGSVQAENQVGIGPFLWRDEGAQGFSLVFTGA